MITILSLLIIGLILLIMVYLPIYFYTYQARDNIQFAMRQIDVYMLEKKILPLAIVYFGLVGFFTILHTHKIFGPVFRFTETLKKMGGGEFNFRIHLRQHDYLKGLQNFFNYFLDTMNTKLGETKSALDNVEADIENLKSVAGEDPAKNEKIGPVIDKIDQHLADLKATLNEFRLDEKSDNPAA